MFFKGSRRRRLREAEFPRAWAEILDRNVPHVRRLTPEQRRELEGHIRVFLAEKTFEGCEGLEMTDEIRVTIAGQACLLLLGRETDYYPGLRTILVYPTAYFAQGRSVGPGGVVTEAAGVRLGESWKFGVSGGPVVLSWEDVRRGAADPGDGRNVTLHEFAHQLDGEDGAVEGAPALGARSRYASWARVLGAEYAELSRAIASGRPHLLGAYAATAPEEFFAVATEIFFERPREMRARHPELYEQLRGFYQQDPAQWAQTAATEGDPAA